MKNPIYRISLFTMALLMAIPSTSQAQNALEAKPASWWATYGEQLVVSLDSPIPKIQEQALSSIIYYAAHHPGKMDFSAATPKILAIYQKDKKEARRTMALMALNALGDETGMRRLNTLVRYEPSPRVEQLTRVVLSAYFGS